MRGRQLKAEQLLRDRSYLLDRYKPRTEAEIYRVPTAEIEEITPAVLIPAE